MTSPLGKIGRWLQPKPLGPARLVLAGGVIDVVFRRHANARRLPQQVTLLL